MADPENKHAINFFTPRGTTMRREVRVITLVLAGWLLAIAGFQLMALTQECRLSAFLNDLTLSFFNLPIHYWLTGQFLPLWFVGLCIVFNLWMDRHTLRTREGSLRFRMPSPGQPYDKGE